MVRSYVNLLNAPYVHLFANLVSGWMGLSENAAAAAYISTSVPSSVTL